ncbi:MAG: 50S ribosome-binding GTPase [Phycisphaerales bacterium]|nr:50S ribosome-binding GTPase [Phycisphaerales bacterium]
MPTGGTIAAICTAPGAGVRAMVRVSGPDARACAHELCGWESPTRSVRTVRFSLAGAELPMMGIWYDRGKSYTGEDTLELAFVGNPIVARRVLDACCTIDGVRQAEPGEFSARAYLNGRLTLQQAEGIALRIAAQHDDALKAAAELLDGSHGRTCLRWSDELAGLLALVEAGVDFTDQEDVVPIAPSELAERLKMLLDELENHLGSKGGQLVRTDLPTVVLVGEPNAGKSTLMNALLGVNRVMVSERAGTTRDAISEKLDLSRDFPGADAVMLTDLAGLGDRAIDAIDAEAQTLARERISKADAIVWCDPSGCFDQASMKLPVGKPTIRVRTKSDLPGMQSRGADLSVCALESGNLAPLRRAIADAASARTGTGVGSFVPRYRRAMREAAEGIGEAIQSLDADASFIALPELVASSMRSALDALGELTGEVTPDDVLGRVFSGFCVGK